MVREAGEDREVTGGEPLAASPCAAASTCDTVPPEASLDAVTGEGAEILARAGT